MMGKRRIPPSERKRTEISCDKCKSRKQKCDRFLDQAKCRYCEIHGIACTSTQPRKKRFTGSIDGPAGLGGRLVLLESLVKGLLPEADLSSNDEIRQEAEALGIPLPEVDNDTYGETEKIKIKSEDLLPLFPDQQGQIQYIGPASSFSFHLKLRKLLQNQYNVNLGFVMFGRNATEEGGIGEEQGKYGFSPRADTITWNRSENVGLDLSDCGSPAASLKVIDGQTLETLMDAYFQHINPDFPVLHESSFREDYESWCNTNTTADPTFMCSLLAILMLSRRHTDLSVTASIERQWWSHIQSLLPAVFFTSNVSAVQALMLTALHLHCTNHRDACWNLTGTAIRIAFAIGLHRDDIRPVQSPLSRELRKQLWWTLYGFEKWQVSSYDRPSAIGQNVSSVGCPNERLVGGSLPQDFMKWSHRLVVLLGSACRALNPTGNVSTAVDDVYNRPLSPAAGILRDLHRWKDALPSHLRLEVIDSISPVSQRQLLLLHAQYHYIVVLISRSALVQRATMLSTGTRESIPQILLTVSETCIDSGQSLSKILRKLENIGKYNSLTWWDVFLTVNTSVVLGLEKICRVRQHGSSSSSESLSELTALAARLLQNTKTTPSNRKWASIVVEVGSLVKQFTSTQRLDKSDDIPHVSSPISELSSKVMMSMGDWEQRDSVTTSGCTFTTSSQAEVSWNRAISLEDSTLARENVSEFWSQFLNFNDQILEWD